MTERRGPGRPRGAASERLATGGRGARLTLTIDGESVRKRVRLETADPAVAERKIERLQSEAHEAPPEPARDTFAEVAAVVFAARRARGVKSVHIETGRIDKHVLPFVGAIENAPFGERLAQAITADEVLELLSAKRDEGYAYEQVNKMRQGIKYVLDHAKRPGLASKMPPFAASVDKRRAAPSDEVLLVYLSWEHPVERFRAGVRMRQAMSAVSRCIGGQRTNDLHVATWEDNLLVPESGEPLFEEVWVPRTKGQAPQLMETPDGVRPMLRLWWEQSGRPRRGPVFPLLRGERAGEARVEVQDSHAAALRQDLKRALGLEVWDPTGGARRSGKWVPGRAPTAKERALFEEGRYTLPLDFHSWRRAWSQALARVGANVQTAAALTGHASDLRAHARYLANPTEAAVVPAGVVPALGAGLGGNIGRVAAKTREVVLENINDSRCVRRDSNPRPLASEGDSTAVFKGFSQSEASHPHLENDEETTGDDRAGQYSRPQFSGLDDLLEYAVSLAMNEGDMASAKALLDVAERRHARTPDNVRPLAKKGGAS